MKKNNKMKLLFVLLVLTATFAPAAKGSEPNGDGIKYCTYVACKMRIGDGFCTHECIPRGWTHGQCLYLPGQKGDTVARKGKEDTQITKIPSNTKGEPEGLSSNDLVAALSTYKIDFIFLSGYLKLIPSELIRAYPNSILNIHPSLLPAFGGKGYYVRKGSSRSL